MSELQTRQIPELPVKYLPTTSARVTGVDEGKVVNFPLGVMGEAVVLTPYSGDTLYMIKASLLSADKDIAKPTLVQFKGEYTRALIMWFEGNVTSDIATVQCWDLTNRKTYTAKSKALPSVTLAEFLSSTYEVALGGDSSSGGFPDLSLEWESPTTKLSVIIDAVRGAGLPYTSRHLFIWLAGYRGALLFANFDMSVDTSSYFCSIKTKDFYSDKWFKASNIDATTITIQDFLNPTGSYVVEEDSSSGDSANGYPYVRLYSDSPNVTTLQALVDVADKTKDNRTLVEIYGFSKDLLLVKAIAYSDGTSRVWATSLYSGRQMEALNVDATTVYLNNFLYGDEYVVEEDGSTCQFPDYTVTWETPATTLSVITDAMGTFGLGSTKNGQVVQLKGYSSALLFCNVLCSPSGGTYSIAARDLYTGKNYSVANADLTTITINEFLNTGTYLVEDENSSGDSDSGYPYGLSSYFLSFNDSFDSHYMSEVKDCIESNGGDITKFNSIFVHGYNLIIKFTYVGGNYYVYCLDFINLKSYYYSINLSTTTIPDFLSMDSVAVSGGITEIPAEYVTESELEAKGYLTETELDAKGYAKTTDVMAYINEAILGGTW